MDEFLNTRLQDLAGVGKSKGALIEKELGITTVYDLLQHFPFRYLDKSKIYSVAGLDTSLPFVQLKLTILSKNLLGTPPGGRLVATASDETGELELVWFRSVSWITRTVQVGSLYLVTGKPSSFNGRISIVHPEMEAFSKLVEPFAGGLKPVYSTTERLKKAGLDSRGVQKLITGLLRASFHLLENLSASIRGQHVLIGRSEAYRCIHEPPSSEKLTQSSRRIKFEELFFLQYRLLKQKNVRTEKSLGVSFTEIGRHFNDFYFHKLPFELTTAQKRVIKEIRADTVSGHQMNRLLQGDVGSGKTIVALLCMLIAIDNGFQACLMAPTEILANQHYETLKTFLGDFISVSLLTGSANKTVRKQISGSLQDGSLHILVGTHALLEKGVIFKNLGLAVIDEQHRFGVGQRAKLWEKATVPPHILVMTATPIPRTLAMTLYGDLDISVIDQLPKGRKGIKTYHYYESKRLKLFGFLASEIDKGRQVYVVYPLIEESEKMDLLHLKLGFELLERSFPKPKYQISIVHGQMKAADKEFEMSRFVRGETQLMIATTVIEVGVNVPNASVMIVENAERFGLSTLHQLRGRVGRGSEQSYCFLMTSYKLSAEAKVRMETLVRTNDGFEIAEVDLALRGMGDLDGTKQSGVTGLHLADLAKDQDLLIEARQAAATLLAEDPLLTAKENEPVAQFLQLPQDALSWNKIS